MSFQSKPRTEGRVAQVVSTWGTPIRGVLPHSIGKVSPEFFERGGSNLASEYDEQIRIPHVLKSVGHPAGFSFAYRALSCMTRS